MWPALQPAFSVGAKLTHSGRPSYKKPNKSDVTLLLLKIN